jgi:hypothetical protein
MKKKILIGVGVAVVGLIALVAVALKTDSPECVELKAKVCEMCGAESKACESIGAAIATTEECVASMGLITGSEETLKIGGEAAMTAFCTSLEQ